MLNVNVQQLLSSPPSLHFTPLLPHLTSWHISSSAGHIWLAANRLVWNPRSNQQQWIAYTLTQGRCWHASLTWICCSLFYFSQCPSAPVLNPPVHLLCKPQQVQWESINTAGVSQRLNSQMYPHLALHPNEKFLGLARILRITQIHDAAWLFYWGSRQDKGSCQLITNTHGFRQGILNIFRVKKLPRSL